MNRAPGEAAEPIGPASAGPRAAPDVTGAVDDLASLGTERGILRVIDGFLNDPAAITDSEHLRRARLTICVPFIAGCTVFATLVAATDRPDSQAIRWFTYALCGVLVASPLFVRVGVPLRWLGHGSIMVMVGYALVLAGSTGGVDSGGFFLAMLTPLPAVLLLGRRAGMAWAVAAAMGMVVLSVVFQVGFEPLVTADPAEVARWSFLACIAGIGGTCGVAMTYDSIQARTMERLVEASRIAEREHARRLELESEFREDLERLVDERTRELRESREQLHHADRLASIGTLAAGVAHQINNPIGSILLASEFALTDTDETAREARYRAALDQNRADAKRCGEIVHNLLRFSRSANGDRVSIDLNEVIVNAIGTLGASSGQVRFERPSEAIALTANPVELEQVMINLVTNALQAGAKTVSLSVRCLAQEALLEVVDDGPGISDADRSRVFDPFFTTRTHEGGTGLGLSVVHRIVEDHGGRIDIESQPGRGTRFLVTLPLDV